MSKLFSKAIRFLILFLSSIFLSAFIGLAQEAVGSPEKNSDYIVFNSEYEPVAQDSPAVAPEEDDLELFDTTLDVLTLEAKRYRREGLRLQNLGRIDQAVTAYQKAIATDPSYAEAYNDLAVLYEIKGWQDEAMELYLQALEIDYAYLPTYSNLAANYEEKGDLKKAAECWKMRVKLGSPDDYWTQKAKKRLDYIALVEKDVAQELRQDEVLDLINDVKESKPNQKPRPPKPEMGESDRVLEGARAKLKSGDLTGALNDAAVAKHIDPTNAQVDIFIEEVEKKIAESFNR